MPEEMSDEQLAKLYVCSDRPTPEDKIIAAALAAVEENPDNTPIHDGGGGGLGFNRRGPAEIAVRTEKRWRPGRALRCAFLDGVGAVQSKVIDVAKQWHEHVNLKLDFVDDGDAEIRISFRRPGSWSYLGTDALVIPDNEATMNYGWLEPGTSDREYSRVVLHEFGHAFGCIHEHSHPDASIPWDEENVYRYYRITNGWDRSKTFNNVIKRYEAVGTNFSAYDPTSIMQYSVPNELTLGDFSIGWNTELSAMDKQFMGTIYPFDERRPGELRPGDRVAGDISSHGEEDKYEFTATDGATYTLETHGSADLVMALYGPDDPTRFVDFDDDSGQSRNARISRALRGGGYQVRVRHYWSTGTGAYELELQEG
jgi:hypothetical protein